MRIFCLILLSVFLVNCSKNYTLDETLPVPMDVKILADVSSAGFEWKISQDSNIEGFILKKKNGQDFKQIKSIKAPNATHIFVDNLASEQHYEFVIHSFRGETISNPSEVLRLKTSFIDPVEKVFISNSFPKTLKLFWSPHANPSIKSYLIERLDGETFRTIAEVQNRLNIEFFDTNLEDGKRYTYAIVARDFMGNKSKRSAQISATTIEKPEALKNITATTDGVKKIKISWDAAETNLKNIKYRIYSSRSENKFEKLADTSALEFTHENLKDGEIYFYKVVALGENELEGLADSLVRGATLSLPLAPTITEALVLDGVAQIRWAAGADSRSQKFIVTRTEMRAGLGGFKSLDYTDIEGLSFADREMKKGISYKYSIHGVDAHGLISPPSNAVELKID